jgi:hypothetical protein
MPDVRLRIGDSDMGVGYELVNVTSRERLMFVHIPANAMREIAGNPIASAMASWYMLNNLGDHISFVPDDGSLWPFLSLKRNELEGFREVTDEVVEALVRAGILEDHGREVFDEAEPGVYMRRLANVWMNK